MRHTTICIILTVLSMSGCRTSSGLASYTGEYGCYTGDPPAYVPPHTGLSEDKAREIYELFIGGAYQVTDPYPPGSVCPLSSLRMVAISKHQDGVLLDFSDGCGCRSSENIGQLAIVGSSTQLQIIEFSGVSESYSVPVQR